MVFWHISNIPRGFRRVKLVTYPHVLYSSNICEILLYNRELVVTTYEPIYVVRAAHRYSRNVIVIKGSGRQIRVGFQTYLDEWYIGNSLTSHHENTRFTVFTTCGTCMRYRWGGIITWWRHQMEAVSALLALCAGNSPVTGEFPSQRPVTRSFDVFFDQRLNKWLSKQSWGWWLRRHRAHHDVTVMRHNVIETKIQVIAA